MEDKNYLSELANDADFKEKYLLPLENDFMKKKPYEENSRKRSEGSFHRDYSRIMYSSSFRRLQGKMQLLGIQNDQFFRNRLTHSLEVAQIARSIALQLGYSTTEIFTVEAGALAHDIGNPPFGHAGERKLDEIFTDIGGFEGNAQTLRTLTTLEKKNPTFPGLNLTYRTLLSVVKYFHKKDDKHTKFIYNDDYQFLEKFIDENKLTIRTLDVQIVDLADEIAYAAHDLEDGLRVKAFIIDEILHDFKSKYGESESFKKLQKLVDDARNSAGYGESKISSAAFNKLFRQELSSLITYTLISDISLIDKDYNFKDKTGTKQTKELGFKTYEQLANGLKEITFKCINHNNDVYYYEERGKALLEYLKNFYSANPRFLPPEYRAEELMNQYSLLSDENKLQQRLICDYISGMMDSFAISEYENISGKSFDNILGDKA